MAQVTVETTTSGETNALAKLAGATRALAEARTLDEVKAGVDLAEAATTYARAARLGLEAQNYAAEIALRGKRKAGEVLAQLRKSRGGRPRKTADQQSAVLISDYRRAVHDAQLPEWVASRWQKLAAVSQDRFDEYVAFTRGVEGEITEKGMLTVAARYGEVPDPEPPVWNAATEARRLLRAAEDWVRRCPPGHEAAVEGVLRSIADYLEKWRRRREGISSEGLSYLTRIYDEWPLDAPILCPAKKRQIIRHVIDGKLCGEAE